MSKRKFRALMSGVAACVALGAFLTGVPLCLVVLVGNPLPPALPAWSSVVGAVDSGVLPPGVAIRVVAVAVWIWWSQIALSFVAEVVAACRGRAARPLPLRAFGMQPVVARLVAIVVTAAGTVGLLAQPAIAATPSFTGIAVPVTASEPLHGPPADLSTASPAGVAAGAATVAAASAAAATSAPPGSPALPAPVLGPPVAGAGVMGPAGAAAESELAPVPGAPVLGPPVGAAMPSGPAAAVGESEFVSMPGPPAPVLAPPLRAAVPSEVAGAVASGDRPALPVPASAPVAADLGAGPTLAASPGSFPALPVPAGAPASTQSAGAAAESPPATAASGAPGGAAAESPSNPGAAGAAVESAAHGWVVVKPGDSLWRLAEKHLGDGLRWEDIYELNAGPLPGGGTLRDPNLIHPGWRLRLPPPDPPASPATADAIAEAAPAPAGPPGPGPG